MPHKKYFILFLFRFKLNGSVAILLSFVIVPNNKVIDFTNVDNVDLKKFENHFENTS